MNVYLVWLLDIVLGEQWRKIKNWPYNPLGVYAADSATLVEKAKNKWKQELKRKKENKETEKKEGKID